MRTIQQFFEDSKKGLQRFMTQFEPGEDGEGGVINYFKQNLRKYQYDEDGNILKIYLNRHKDKYITTDEIKQLYEIAEDEKRACPLIVDYRGVVGNFVFRRWVGKLDIFKHIDILNDKGSPYMGLHNTSMREDGKFFPSAEAYEIIIAYAYNKYRSEKTMGSDVENIKVVTGHIPDPNTSAEQIMNYANNNENIAKDIVDEIPTNSYKMRKLPAKEVKVTNDWYEYGSYKDSGFKPNNTPKTDLIAYTSDNMNKPKYRISLKKHGGSQLMSGYENEARATLMYAAEQLPESDKKEHIKSIISRLFSGDKWVHGVGSNDLDKKTKGSENHQDLNEILKEIFASEENQDYKKLVIMEAMTGQGKFGKDSPACADHIFVWDDVNKANCKFLTVEQYADEILKKGVTISISYKGTNDKSSSALRIVTK